jgi:homogentisate 1,2-dioxygenase
MVDTVFPLQVTRQAIEHEKPDYTESWLEGNGE